ncbi:MAG: Tetratricopeptide domain protein [Pedosphaera sp.]|jgi:tetratricopeptide (TPR) repeat protein|nr:Tetratricopeptide domain protein [Pedosphaera sp.]
MSEKSLTELTRDLRGLYNRGNDAIQRENYDYAIELFTQLLTQDPCFYECRKALRLAQHRKAGTASRGFFKKVFSGANSSPLVAKGQMALRNSPLEALQIAEQILMSDANSTGGHRLLAEAALAADMPRTAIMSLEVVVRNMPKDKSANMQLAEALAKAGEQTKAEKIYAELQREYPNDNDIFMALKNVSASKTMDEGGYGALEGGQGSYRDILKNKAETVSLEQENRQVKTEDVAERLILEKEARLKTEPTNLKLLRDLGELCTEKNQFDRALGFYEKIVAIDGGNDSSLQRKIAETKVRKFDYTAAQLDPATPDYAEKLAQIKADRIAYQLDECRQRAERYPTDLQIRFEFGVLLFETGKLSEAIQEFQKAINNPHRRIQAMNYLAQCFARRGMNDLAAKRLQDALKEKLVLDDEKKDLIYTLGSVLEKMGKREEAIEQFKLLYEVDIGYKDVAAKIDAYYAGS